MVNCKKKCPSDKICNNLTGRCVKSKGKIGKSLNKKIHRSPSPKKRSPSRKHRSPSLKKRSPSRNHRSPSPKKRSSSPKNKKRSLSRKHRSPSPKKRSPSKKRSSRKTSADKCKNVICSADNICNPLSGRCVKKSGKIGKNLSETNSSTNIFTIYTAGISDFGDISKISHIWNTFLRDVVLKNINKAFNIIIIKHYDPIGMNSKIIKFIKDFQLIINNDISYSNHERKIKSELFIENLPIETIKGYPHIILDFAHLFRFLPNNALGQKQIQINGYYGEPLSERHIYTNINAVYPGYVGRLDDIEEGYTDRYLSNTNFFKTDAMGNVTTFIDRIFTLGYNLDESIIYGKQLSFDDITPSNVIVFIFKRIRELTMNNFRTRKGNLQLFDEFYTEDLSKYIVSNIIDTLMDQTKNMSLKELIDYIYMIHVKPKADSI
jgi:hypothetical protein